MKNKAYVGIGSVSMGIMGSFCNPQFFQDYLGIRAEWVDMTEVLRRMKLEIYDHEEFERALAWTKAHVPRASIRTRRRKSTPTPRRKRNGPS